MADTARTRAQILTLLADNTTGEISPQDVRDMLVSLFGIYGSIRTVDNVVAQAVVAATPEVLTEFTKNGLAVGMTPDFANNKITVVNTGVYLVSFHASFISSVDATVLKANLAVDGVSQDAAFQEKLVLGADVKNGSCSDILSLNAAEELSVNIESSQTGNLTFQQAQLVAYRIG